MDKVLMYCLEELDPDRMGCAKLFVNKYVDKCSSRDELQNVLSILDLI